MADTTAVTFEKENEPMAEDIRWKQRLDNYSKALRQLTDLLKKEI
jgi:hypothetical protein